MVRNCCHGIMRCVTFQRTLTFLRRRRRLSWRRCASLCLDSLAAASQALPTMVAQGADPSKLVASLAAVTNGIKSGKAIEDIVLLVFAPPPPEPAQAPPGVAAPGDPSSPPVSGPPGSEAPGQAGPPAGGPMAPPGGPPQGRPDLLTLMAGNRGGMNPILGANVRRSMPVA